MNSDPDCESHWLRARVGGRIKMGSKFVCGWLFFRRRREFIGTTDFLFGFFVCLFVFCPL